MANEEHLQHINRPMTDEQRHRKKLYMRAYRKRVRASGGYRPRAMSVDRLIENANYHRDRETEQLPKWEDKCLAAEELTAADE